MGYTKEQRIINSVSGSTKAQRNAKIVDKGSPEQTPIATGMYLPNHSGIASHPEATSTFVKKAGDTMGGRLNINVTSTSDPAINLTNAIDEAESTVWVSGSQTERGTVKISHNKPAGSDADAAALSIDCKGTGTAAQAIFVDATEGGTTGKLLNIRNNGSEKFVVDSNGKATAAGGADMGSSKITNLGTPTASTDASTKGYVDGKSYGIADLNDLLLEDLEGGEIIYYLGDDELWYSLKAGVGYLQGNVDGGALSWGYPTLQEVLSSSGTSGNYNITMSTTYKVYWRDTGLYIYSSVDGQLDLVADTTLKLDAPTVTATNLNCWKIADCDAVQVSHTGTTTETIVKTWTIPGGTLGANGGLRLVWMTHSDGSAGNKIWRLRFGTTGTSSAQIFYQAVSSTNDCVFAYREIWNRNSVSSQICSTASSVFIGGGSANPSVTSINTASDCYLYLTCQLANSAETAYLEHYCLEWNNGKEAYT